MSILLKLSAIALMSVAVGQIARCGMMIMSPEALSCVVGGATLLSIFAGIYLAREE